MAVRCRHVSGPWLWSALTHWLVTLAVAGPRSRDFSSKINELVRDPHGSRFLLPGSTFQPIEVPSELSAATTSKTNTQRPPV